MHNHFQLAQQCIQISTRINSSSVHMYIFVRFTLRVILQGFVDPIMQQLPLCISVHNNTLRSTSHIRFIMRFMHLVLLAWARLVQRENVLFSSCDFFISSLQIGGGFKERKGLPLSDHFLSVACSFQEKLAKIIGLQ